MDATAQDNMRIWDALCETDPHYTKGFHVKFKGTSVNPTYAIQKMTEVFGPCGTGWGMEAPVFTLQEACEGQRLVFCTLAVWYQQAGQPRSLVYGVGGDFVIKKLNNKLEVDDNSYKKVYTDAFKNAVKFLGNAADIHLGLYDDDKYVSALREKYDEEDAGSEPPPSRPPVPDMTRPPSNGADQSAAPRKSLTRMFAALRQYGTAPDVFKAYMQHRWEYTSSTQLTAAEIQEVMRLAPHGPSAFQIPAAAPLRSPGPQPGDPWHAAWNDLHTVCRNAEFNLARVRTHLCERFQVAEVQQIPVAQLREFTRLVITNPKDEGLSIPERDALSQPVETQ